MRAAGRVVATHLVVTDGRDEIWDPEHRRVAEAAALASTRPRHLHIVAAAVADTAANRPVGRLELPGGDFDVAAPDLAARYDHQDPA